MPVLTSPSLRRRFAVSGARGCPAGAKPMSSHSLPHTECTFGNTDADSFKGGTMSFGVYGGKQREQRAFVTCSASRLGLTRNFQGACDSRGRQLRRGDCVEYAGERDIDSSSNIR